MKKIILLLVLMNSLGAMAQQIPDLYHYYMYPALYNPAATGMHDYTEVLTLYKNQWAGIPDGPQTQLLMVNTPLKNKKFGLGFTFYNDLAHIIGTTGAYTSLAYRLQLSEDHLLNFGLSLGAFSHRIFFDKIRAEDPFESSLLNNSESMVKADASAGISYHWKKLSVGFASQHLIQDKFHFQNVKDNKSLYYKLARHYTVSTSYMFSLHPNFEIEPMILIRSAQGLPSQAEVNNTFRYKGKVWINLSYRHEASAGVSLGFMVDNKLTVGYHYEYPLSGIRKATNSAYEIAVSYRFGKKHETLTHEGIEKLQKDNEEQYEMIDQLDKKTDTIKNRLDQHDTEILQLKEIYKKEQDETNKLKQEEEVPVSTISKDKAHTHHDHYLVVGSFSNVQNAKLYQQVIKREYNIETRMALSRAIGGKSRFLVYTIITKDSEEAKKEMKRLKEMDKKKIINQDPWLYRVK